MFIELLERDVKILQLYQDHPFDASFGTSVSIGHFTFLKGTKSYSFNEDDDDIVPLYALISYPFCTKIIHPKGLRYKHWKEKRVFHNSTHKLAYLHPNWFKPDENVLEKYHLKPREYILVRNSALKAHHDIGIKGLVDVWDKVYKAIADYPLVYSKEGEKSHAIEPWDMHHIMAFAKMIVSDSQSMTYEGAILGTPSIRCNSFVGRISYMEAIEHTYELTYGFKPEQVGKMVNKVLELLHTDDLEITWQQKKNRFLSEKQDMTRWMIDYFEKEISKKGA